MQPSWPAIHPYRLQTSYMQPDDAGTSAMHDSSLPHVGNLVQAVHEAEIIYSSLSLIPVANDEEWDPL